MAKYKCSDCEYAQYFKHSNGYVSSQGKTKPHYCPLTDGKKYLIHKNLGRNTAYETKIMVTDYYGSHSK